MSSSAGTARRKPSTRGISSSPPALRTRSRSRVPSPGNTLRVSMNAYTFRVQQPEARRVEVDLQVESRGADALDVRLPVWTPGSYLVREHQRHVDGLSASADGRELPVEKIDKHTWRVRPDGARMVRSSYRLHCFELSVRTNHVDGTAAVLD